MIKFSRTSDFDFDMPSVSLLHSAKELTKRASARDLLKFEKTAKQTDLHIIAVGSYEGTGFNRNGDAFSEKDCISNHNHFTKSNRAVHRHHKNKPEDPKYGNIKAAAYNKPMRRIELIVGLDNDKCSDILDEQEKTGNSNWSMASRQNHDVCSWCGRKAHTEKDRCEHIPKNIGELNKVGEMCGMHNPNPNWFEISYVRRPADRIGMSLKLASDSTIRPMTTGDFLSIYTGFTPPVDELLISKHAEDKRTLLQKLAEIEKHVDAISKAERPAGKMLHMARTAKKLNQAEDISPQTMDELRKFEPSKLLKALADKGIVFSPDEFTKYTFGDRVPAERVKGMKTHLPGMFSGLNDTDTAEIANNDKFEPSQSNMLPPEIKKMVESLIGGHSLSSEPAVRRVMRITIMCGNGEDKHVEPKLEPKTKEAFDKELAKQYCGYKVAALQYMSDNDLLDEDVLFNSIVQNRK